MRAKSSKKKSSQTSRSPSARGASSGGTASRNARATAPDGSHVSRSTNAGRRSKRVNSELRQGDLVARGEGLEHAGKVLRRFGDMMVVFDQRKGMSTEFSISGWRRMGTAEIRSYQRIQCHRQVTMKRRIEVLAARTDGIPQYV